MNVILKELDVVFMKNQINSITDLVQLWNDSIIQKCFQDTLISLLHFCKLKRI